MSGQNSSYIFYLATDIVSGKTVSVAEFFPVVSAERENLYGNMIKARNGYQAFFDAEKQKFLNDLHKEGYIHEDIYPGKIRLYENGYHRLVLDTVVISPYGKNEGKNRNVILRPGYSPVENYTIKGKRGPWTNIYALCAVCYECLTGVKVPSVPDRIGNCDIFKKPSELGIKLPPHMESAVLKGLNIHGKDRYQNISGFCEDFFKDYMKEGNTP